MHHKTFFPESADLVKLGCTLYACVSNVPSITAVKFIQCVTAMFPTSLREDEISTDHTMSCVSGYTAVL